MQTDLGSKCSINLSTFAICSTNRVINSCDSISFSLCNCACSMALSGEFSHFPYAIVLLPLISLRQILFIFPYNFSCSMTLSGSPRLFPLVPLLSSFTPSQNSLHNPSTMSRERGKYMRGLLYYMALSICGILTLSQLILIILRNNR
jgi:hypothetical protein